MVYLETSPDIIVVTYPRCMIHYKCNISIKGLNDSWRYNCNHSQIDILWFYREKAPAKTEAARFQRHDRAAYTINFITRFMVCNMSLLRLSGGHDTMRVSERGGVGCASVRDARDLLARARLNYRYL